MKTLRLCTVVCVLGVSVIALGSCAQTETQGTNNANGGSNSSTTNSAGNTLSNAINSIANSVGNAVASAVTDDPVDFMMSASQGGMAEVELGKLATSKTQNPEVKKFAQMMVADHGKANSELKTLADGERIALPADLGSHQQTIDELKGLSGPDFDRAYVEAMISDHEKTVANFMEQSQNGADPEVKAFATKTLPALKKHLEAVKSIKAKMQ